jgi:hypothetical protein
MRSNAAPSGGTATKPIACASASCLCRRVWFKKSAACLVPAPGTPNVPDGATLSAAIQRLLAINARSGVDPKEREAGAYPALSSPGNLLDMLAKAEPIPPLAQESTAAHSNPCDPCHPWSGLLQKQKRPGVEISKRLAVGRVVVCGVGDKLTRWRVSPPRASGCVPSAARRRTVS